LFYNISHDKNAEQNTQKIMLPEKSGKNWIQSILVTTRFLENFGGRIFIFGHFINVQFSKQPINNDCKNNNSNTY
jgi:hypothetical protein